MEKSPWKDGEVRNRVQKADWGLRTDQSQAAENRIKLSECFVLHGLSRR